MGIYKSERLCWGSATEKQTLASGMCGTWSLRWHFLTGVGQVSKFTTLMISRQHKAGTRICPWPYTYVIRQQICFEHIKAKATSLCFVAQLLHCMTLTPAFSVLHAHYTILFTHFSCYTLERDKTIFPVTLTRRMLQKFIAPVVVLIIFAALLWS